MKIEEMKIIEAEHNCIIKIEPSHRQKGYVWLHSRTAVAVNSGMLLSPEAVKQLRKALKQQSKGTAWYGRLFSYRNRLFMWLETEYSPAR